VLTSTTQDRQLDPRYRRVLSFGEVLDESIGLFRRHWKTFALVSAIWLIPPGLLSAWMTASGAFDTTGLATQLRTGRSINPDRFANLAGASLLVLLVASLFTLAWTASVVLAADEYVHLRPPDLGQVLMRTLRRYLPALLSGFLYFVAELLLVLVASLVVVVWVLVLPVAVLATLGAIAGLLVWWLRPRWRRSWLKWFIIVATPFGLPLYFGVSWSMYLPAAVLERHGPIGALRRSMQLVRRHWFRVLAILVIAGLIVWVLQVAPALLVELPLSLGALARGGTQMGPTEQAISTAADVLFQVLFASLGFIVYAILYLDLRNRREGTDIAERVSQLEALSPAPSDA
jgi:hypothetical protein